MKITLRRLATVLLMIALLVSAPVAHAEPSLDPGLDHLVTRLASWLGFDGTARATEPTSDTTDPTTSPVGDEGPLDPTTTASKPGPNSPDGEMHPDWDPDG